MDFDLKPMALETSVKLPFGIFFSLKIPSSFEAVPSVVLARYRFAKGNTSPFEVIFPEILFV
jgi:hypothetical protein